MPDFFKLTKDSYKFASYYWNDFSNYTLHDKYSFLDISLSKRHGKLSWNDKWMAELFEANILPADAYQHFLETGLASLTSNPELWNNTIEGIYSTLNTLRSEFVDPKKVSRYRVQKLGLKSQSNRKEGRLYDVKMLEELLSVKQVVIIAVSDLEWVEEALDFCMTAASYGKKIFFLTKEKTSAPLITANELEDYICRHNVSFKKPYHMLFDHGEERFIDFSKVYLPCELQADIANEKVFLCCFGEDLFLSAHDLTLPTMAFTSANTIYARALLNEFEDSTTSLVYIPESFNLFGQVPIIEAPQITFYHYYFLAKRFGKSVYEQDAALLKCCYPTWFINIYNDFPEAGGFLHYLPAQKLPSPLLPFQFCEPINYRFETEDSYIFSDYYHWQEDNQNVRLAKNWENNTLVNGLIKKSNTSIRVHAVEQPLKHSLRNYLRIQGLLDKPSFFCNFLFFSTNDLTNRYNILRQDRPKEQINDNCNYIDYFLRAEDGYIRQSFPLYRKACIGKTFDGKIFFTQLSLKGGAVSYKGYTISWKPQDVNPDFPEDVAVYTPMLSQKDQGCSRDDYTLQVGEGRLNLVINGDELVCVREGDVLLSPIGITVSLSGKSREAFLKHFFAFPDRFGYYSLSGRVTVRLEAPSGIDKYLWSKAEWIYGGGISLISRGENYFENEEQALLQLEREGWLTPLSLQTQESNVHDLHEHHPRTLLGLTADGHFFVMVFSGRSRFTRSVTYCEASMIVRKYIKNVQELIAVDGGASSFFGYGQNNTFIELSYPACTESTSTGLVRRVSNLLIL